MTGYDSKRRMALDRLDDDDIQVYAQPELKGMTEDEAQTLAALKYAASIGHGRMVRGMKIAPFTIKEALAQPDYRAVKTYHGGKPVYVSQPEQDWSWVCNECGAREFTSALSETDLEHLACSECGSDEFHKVLKEKNT